MPPYTVRDKRTGEVHRFEWSGPNRPSRWDIDEMVNQRKSTTTWDKARSFGSGIWDTATSIGSMFNPLRENPESPLGFDLMTPSRYMAEGMIDASKSLVGNVGEGEYGRASLNALDLVGLPATATMEAYEGGDPWRAAGLGFAGLGLAAAGMKAGRGGRVIPEAIPEAPIAPPTITPGPRGYLGPPSRFVGGEAGGPPMIDRVTTPQLFRDQLMETGTPWPPDAPGATAMDALIPERYKRAQTPGTFVEPQLGVAYPEVTGPIYTPVTDPNVLNFPGGPTKTVGKSKSKGAKAKKTKLAPAIGVEEPIAPKVTAPKVEVKVEPKIEPDMLSELQNLFKDETGSFSLGGVKRRGLKDVVEENQKIEIERRKSQLTPEEMRDRDIMFDRRGTLKTEPQEFVPPTKGTLAEMEKQPEVKLPGSLSYEEAAKTIFDEEGRIKTRPREGAVGQRRLAQTAPKDEVTTAAEKNLTPEDKPLWKKLLDDERGSLRLFGRKPNPEGNMFHRKTGHADFDEVKFPEWVRGRRASALEGIVKSRDFRELDNLGLEGIKKFQQGDRTGAFQRVQEYFDKKHTDLEAAGIKMGFKENYLPQLWDNSVDEVMQAQRRLGLKPTFTMKSVLENYQKGIDAGLKPRFEKVSDLVGWYESRAQKAVADRQFFDYLKQNKLIVQKGKAPSHWVSLDPDHFPINKFISEVKGVRGAKPKSIEKDVIYTAEPKIARAINNYLGADESVDVRNIADKISFTKNLALSAGIPKTGISAHGFNILHRNQVAKGILKGSTQGLKYMLRPGTAAKYVEQNLSKAVQAVKDGVMLTTEDHLIGQKGGSRELLGKGFVGKKLGKLAEVHGKLFEDPLFQKMIPAMKLEHWDNLKQGFIERGMEQDKAGRLAADITNENYGGIDWESMQRSRDFQNLLRSFVLAPDWAESNARIARGAAKSLIDPSNPKGKAYRSVVRNMLYAYALANVANKTSSGKFMWENESGKTLQVYLGKDSKGKEVYFNPFGTAADWFRLPYDTAASIAKGDLGGGFRILKNRMSLVARAAANLTMNVDQRGRAIWGKDSYGRKIPVKTQAANITREAAEPILPQYVQAPLDMAMGRSGPEEAVAGATELPFRFSQPRRRRGSKIPVPTVRLPKGVRP